MADTVRKLARLSTAREFNEDLTKAAEDYTAKYLRKNKLGMYLDGYKKLDDIINLFFINYAKLGRSSLNCARLWVAVMQCRTQMTNAITHLVDQQRYIALEYKDLRMRELNDHIYTCRIFVAKAVQYIVTFIKHKEEDWRFLRKGFLEMYSISLADLIFKATDAWKEFIIDGYELDKHTADAYRNHLKHQEERCRIALRKVEPHSKIAKTNNMWAEKLETMYRDRKTPEVQKEDYFALRVLLNTVGDCFGTESFISKTIFGEENMSFNITESEGDGETIETVKRFLKKEIPDIVKDDQKVWPHQKGLEDLGPFQMIDLPDPQNFLELDMEKKEYQLKPEFARIAGLSMFKGKPGKSTNPTPVTFAKNELKALNIPLKAETFTWCYPVYPDKDCDLTETFSFANDHSPLHVALLYGFFAYFDKNSELICVKGVTMGDDLFFDGPYFIPNPNAYTELEKEEHVPFEPVTLAPLLAMDAKAFAWVNPGQEKAFQVETVGGGSLVKGWKFKGAFAYMYSNEGKDPEFSKRRNYFQVLTFQEANMKRQKNVNTPVVSSLRILYHTFKEQWREFEDEANHGRTAWDDTVFRSSKGLAVGMKSWF